MRKGLSYEICQKSARHTRLSPEIIRRTNETTDVSVDLLRFNKNCGHLWDGFRHFSSVMRALCGPKGRLTCGEPRTTWGSHRASPLLVKDGGVRSTGSKELLASRFPLRLLCPHDLHTRRTRSDPLPFPNSLTCPTGPMNMTDSTAAPERKAGKRRKHSFTKVN